MPRPSAAILLILSCASMTCAQTGTVGVVAAETETSAGTLSPDDGGDDGRTAGNDGTSFDLSGGSADACSERDIDTMGVGECAERGPPDGEFEPAIQWEWHGRDDDTDTRVIALVANLTDDDGDGDVDLCDTPEIIVTAGPPPEGNPNTMTPPDAHLYALDGASGIEHWRSDEPVRATITPALGDIDGNPGVEIVTLQSVGDPTGLVQPSRLITFAADGSVLWTSATVFDAPLSDAVAIADLDLDRDTEIIIGNRVFDHTGGLLFAANDVGETSGLPLLPLAVDLDDDDDLEVLWSRAAYHHDGSVMWENAVRPGIPHVANLNTDPAPEIVVTTENGILLLRNNGTSVGDPIKPLNAPDSNDTWRRPAAIQDINGDRRPELLLSIGESFVALEVTSRDPQLTVVLEVGVIDPGGHAGGTAFDFMGDAKVEGMYGDQRQLHVFASDREEAEFTVERSSVTLEEYPVVADVDNDGSAEIVVGSNATAFGVAPTIRVIGDPANRWVSARRIWNQHTYHVTNIGENGRVPTPEPHHWTRTNTFRTNAQTEFGAVCLPPAIP
ncbi:MAG: hypothetical protein AAF721_07680 [Myxococcota bacterium]